VCPFLEHGEGPLAGIVEAGYKTLLGFGSLAVSKKESRYKLVISSSKTRQKSALVAYGVGFWFALCISFLL
jgi:hypothetical protein